MRRLRLVLGVSVLLFTLAGSMIPARAAPEERRVVRITYFAEAGWTYGGTWTTEQRTAACSWDIPLFATVAVSGIDGDHRFVCEDRGQLGSNGWIDVYDPTGGVPDQFGDYTLAEIEP